MDVKQAFKSVFVSESDRIKTKLSEKKEKFKRLTSPKKRQLVKRQLKQHAGNKQSDAL